MPSRFRTVLLSLDGSPLSERALPFGAWIARAANAQLILVRAVPPRHGYAGSERSESGSPTMQLAQAYLSTTADQLRAHGLRVDECVRQGEAAKAIAEAGQAWNAELIVMSTHGRSGFGRWIYGSVSEAVLRGAGRPVLLIPAACERTWSPGTNGTKRRVLMPLDGSRRAEEVLGPAMDLAELLGAELLLLRIAEPPTRTIVSPDGYLYEYAESDVQTVLEEARRYLDEMSRRLQWSGRPVSVEVRESVELVGSVIAAVAREERVDAIAMATLGFGGDAVLTMGSVASVVMQAANAPVLLVRPATAPQLEAEETSGAVSVR